MGEHMTTGSMNSRVIGYRSNGTPIHLIQGGADDPEPQAPPAPPVDDSAALRAELDAAKAQAAQTEERLRALMAANETPAAPADGDDGEDEPEGGKPADPEMAKLHRALRAANRESKARREAAERLRTEWEAQEAATKAQVVEAQKLAEAAEKARMEAESRYKPATIKAAAVPALLAAGAKADRADRLVKLLDMAALDVDTTGAVTGLAEQVAAVKADWPELFVAAEEQRRPVPRVATGDRAPVQDAPTRSADILARQVLGGAA